MKLRAVILFASYHLCVSGSLRCEPQAVSQDELREMMKRPPPHDSQVGSIICANLLREENHALLVEALASDDKNVSGHAGVVVNLLRPDWAVPYCVDALRKALNQGDHAPFLDFFQWKRSPAAIPQLRRALGLHPVLAIQAALALAWQDDKEGLEGIRTLRDKMAKEFSEQKEWAENELARLGREYGEESEYYTGFKKEIVGMKLRREYSANVFPLDIAVARLTSDPKPLGNARALLISSDIRDLYRAITLFGWCGSKEDIAELVPFLDSGESHIVNTTVLALRRLTGLAFRDRSELRDIGKHEAQRWKEWWNENRGK